MKILHRGLHAEVLERRTMLSLDGPVISEFMASNEDSLLDQFGRSRDWIELYNPTAGPVSLSGWHLTDDPQAELAQMWSFPAVNLAAGEFMIVFASGQNLTDPNQPLHTNFRLRASGDFLALIRPDGTVAHSFGDSFPPQFEDTSFGLRADSMDLFPAGAPFSYHVPVAPDADLGTSWSAVDFNAADWSKSEALLSDGIGYALADSLADFEGQFVTDVSGVLPNHNGSLWLRQEFELADPTDISGLQLDINYDDGFLALLNGVAVAEVNTPGGGLTWQSEADVPRRPRRQNSDALVAESFEIGSHVDLLIPGTNVLAIHALNDTADDEELFVKARLTGYQMADELNTQTVGYLTEPTPGGANRPLRAGSVTASAESQFFREMFSVELSTPSDDHAIRITLDGTTPTVDSPMYAGPIEVSQTTNLRAAAFTAEGVSGPVTLRNYVKLAEEVSNFSSDLPVVVINSDTINLDRSPDGIQRNVRNHSVMGFFEPGADGRTTIGLEPMLFSDASVRRRGDSTASNPKVNMDVEFQTELGAERDIEVFGMPAESDWVFHGPYQFDHTGGVRNSFYYEISRQLGHWASDTRFVEVFHNANGEELSLDDYQGIYIIIEKIKRGGDRVDIRKLNPDDVTEPNVSGGWIFKIDQNSGIGQFTAGGQIIQLDYPEGDEIADNRQVDWLVDYFNGFRRVISDENASWQQVQEFVDVASWIDHSIINELATNSNYLERSTYFHKDRGGKIIMGPNWDCDRCMASDPETWGVRVFTSRWWRWLHELQPDYWQAWIDRWYELRDEQLTAANVDRLIDTFASQVEESQQRNYERWTEFQPDGGAYADPGLSGWAAEVSDLRNWLHRRMTWLDNEFVSPVTISPPSRQWAVGLEISLEADEGVIYYTLDGSEPRATGGAVSPTAIAYSGPFILTQPATVTARALHQDAEVNLLPRGLSDAETDKVGSPWSAPTQAHFSPRPLANSSNLRIVEVHYNPLGATPAELQVLGPKLGTDAIDNDEFEFLELTNIGDVPIELDGARLVTVEEFGVASGVEFTFAEQTLGPGERIVLAENVDAFQARYGDGIRIASGSTGRANAREGQYGGRLENRGETLWLTDAFGNSIQRFAYNDTDPWPAGVDGEGRSLELIDVTSDFRQPENWRASRDVGGSPGTAGGELLPLIGDSNRDGIFDQLDIVNVLAGGKYLSGQAATFAEGDWNGDGVFDRFDIIAALVAGHYIAAVP